MIQGEPLKETPDEASETMDAPNRSPVSPDPETGDFEHPPLETSGFAGLPVDNSSDDDDESDTLDADVQNLLHALASEELDNDEEWIDTSRKADESAQDDRDGDADEPSEESLLEHNADDLSDSEALHPFAEQGDPDAAFDDPEDDHLETGHLIGEELAATPDHVTDEDDNARGQDDTGEDDDLQAAPLDLASSAIVAAPLAAMAHRAVSTDADADDENMYPEGLAATREDAAPAIAPPFMDGAENAVSVALDDNADELEAEPEDTAPVISASSPLADIEAEATETVESKQQSTDLLGLQAINAIGEKITASETRYDDALAKMGHALGVIAQRIDGLESRMTDQTIANVALAASPPDEDDEEEDHSVAPYIARAEKELKARKGAGSMDIFDRIAKAAETEFDDQTVSSDSRVLQNTSNGRRVGTKRWQPSKNVKRRMEKLEQARNTQPDAATTGEPKNPAARKLRTELDSPADLNAAPVDSADLVNDEAQGAPEPILDLNEHDDSGLSVLPGARGRRRNRARKSRLDEDFEDVFAEDEDGKPSIQSLRRKMRERPAEEESAADSPKGGMLSGILGKKSARKVEPADVEDHEDDDEDLMAAFDDEAETPAKSKKAKKSAKPAKKQQAIKVRDELDDDYDDDEHDDEDWGDDEHASNSRKRPVLYALIAAAAAAGFFVWKTFIG